MSKCKHARVVEAIDGIARPEGSAALRERLRMLDPRAKIVALRASDVLITLNELQAWRIACQVQGAAPAPVAVKGRRGRRIKLADDTGREGRISGRVEKLLRLRPDLVKKVEAFAKESGGAEPWSFNRAVNEILNGALRERAR